MNTDIEKADFVLEHLDLDNVIPDAISGHKMYELLREAFSDIGETCSDTCPYCTVFGDRLCPKNGDCDEQ